MLHRGANKKKRKSSRSKSRKSSHSSRTATLQEEIQELTSLIDQHDQMGHDGADMTDAASASQPTSESRSVGLGEAIHPPLTNHDRIYEGPRYCLLLRVNKIMYGGMKPLPAHAWTEAKVKDLMKLDLETTRVAILDQTRATLYCRPTELGKV